MQEAEYSGKPFDAVGPPPPQRVQTAIAELQNASERLIGWCQLAVVCLFGGLYAASPKPLSPENTFSAVPWVLLVYLMLTIGRLALAYRFRLAPWLLIVSILVDVTLLMGLIWTFHFQYEQPPTFYLKSPTLLYVFIFIALRALRFEARYVVLAGLAAALGWIGMAAYALSTEGWQAVTRDYVYYMTSNRLLIGAELDKVITIFTVTAIVAAAIHRARRTMIRSVADTTAVHDLSRFFAPEIARRITAAEEEITAGQGKVRQAAVLNTDIRGFSQMSERLAPNELMALLAEYQARLVPIIRQHGGTIDKFMGDGILATFGAAVPTDTYAADALRAADDIIARFETWDNERRKQGRQLLKIGVAVATGRVVFGAVGDPTRLEYTVIGKAVNISAKLEKHTKAENVNGLCTLQTHQLAISQGYRPPAERPEKKRRRIPGIRQSLDLVVLVR